MPYPEMFIDVEGLNQVVTGPGPLFKIVNFAMKRRINAAGEWRALVAATDPRVAELCDIERTIQVYGMINGVKVWLGGGIIQNRKTRISKDGVPFLNLSGTGLLGELARDTVGIFQPSTAAGDTNLNTILGTMFTGWTSTVTGTTKKWLMEFDNASTLEALVSIATKLDVIFRLEEGSGDPRHVAWYNTLPSTVKAHLCLHPSVYDVHDSDKTAIIEEITEVENSYGLVNQAIIKGGGESASKLWVKQMIEATHVWPDDSSKVNSGTYSGPYGHTYSYDSTDGFIQVDDSVATYGPRFKRITFPDITEVPDNNEVNGDTFDYAMNMLIKTAVNTLGAICVPSKVYNITVAGLDVDLLPGDLVTVDARVYRDGEAPIDIQEQDLIAIEVENRWSEDGTRRTIITAGETRRAPSSGSGTIVRSMQQTGSYEVAPQPSANIQSTSLERVIDGSNDAVFPFFVSGRHSRIRSVVLRYKIDELVSTIAGGKTDKAVTGIVINDKTNLATSSQGTNATSTDGAHSHTSYPDGIHFHNMVHNHNIADHNHMITEPNAAAGHEHNYSLSFSLSNDTSGMVNGDITWSINGGAQSLSGAAVGSTGFYSYDMTSYVRNATSKRKSSEFNYFTATHAAATKQGRITAIIEVVTDVQPLGG